MLGLSGTALSQALPTPGSVNQSFGTPRLTLPASPAQVLIPQQVDAPLHERNGKRFQVHSFRFVGATVVETQRLKRVVERFIDLELNLYDVVRAADAVTEFYLVRGYSLCRAFIPAQRVDDGVVTLVVVEGRVGGVLFSGNERYASDWLAQRTADLTPDSLIEARRLERQLLLLNDLPGVQARATLSPGPRFGTSDVLIKLEESLLGGSLTLDNTGRKETGQWRADLGADINNPTGRGDQLKLRANRTEHDLSTFASIGYNFPVGNDGWRLAASYSDVRYQLAGDFVALGIEGGARTADVALSWPMTRTRGANETLAFSARRTQLSQKVLGTSSPTVSVPMLSTAYVASWIGSDAAVTTLLLQASSNGRRNTNGTSTDAVRLRLELDATYLLPLDRYWDVYLRGAGSYSPERLPDSEKYSLGGASSVRGYRSSELRGDAGWQGTLEFRRRLTLRPVFAAVPASSHLFGDLGRVTNKAPGFDNSYDGITSWGIGIAAYPVAKTTLKIDFAKTAGGFRAGDGETKRLWASLSTSF